MKEGEMQLIADVIIKTLSAPDDTALQTENRKRIADLCTKFPIYSGLSYTS